jgi:hypothetical protein
MNCKICQSKSTEFYKGKILMKYDVSYFQCEKCNFIQTENPHWLNEAYASAITHLDIGLLNRNLYLIKEIPKVIDTLFPKANLFLDYGGGYGVFVRMMRDLGYNFFRFDTYCDNIFSNFFDIKDCKESKFDIVTSFEVFEHLESPLNEVKKMFEFADTIVFSTLLIPENRNEFSKWWYVSPETGQHIAFYHKKTFSVIAEQFNCNYYSNNSNLHILTKHKLDDAKVSDLFSVKKASFFEKIFNRNKNKSRESLIPKDLQMITTLLNSGKIKS